ncbi:MAG: hypothetical protein A2666_02880 [Parcubacteria group bacterium RIFCSPHIGHO2_01_FULL_47_10b]|nr:MAG: hypothetical protein A2666_02880 [Parcubacteria group bacterium RIFCSPHIGHO2_01_FULL_47_10b]
MLTDQEIKTIQSKLNKPIGNTPLMLQALGDAGRFNIFRVLMDHHDICVTDVAHIFGITVSAASQQLRVLERLGLVIKIRMGQMVCYEINRAHPTVKHMCLFIKKVDKQNTN